MTKVTSKIQKNLTRLRREFEIPAGVVFLNHASFGPVPRRGRRAVEELLNRQGRFSRDPDVDAESYAILEQSRRLFARMIGQDFRRVAFAPNASYGLNAILWGMSLGARDRVLLPRNEFPAVTYAVRSLTERIGATMVPLPCPDGHLALDQLEAELQSGSTVLALSWVQYFNGFRNNMREITALCHAHGCAVVVDATQGAGAIPLNMRLDGFDALACGAQKWLLGQTGAGWFALAANPIRPISPCMGGWLGYDWGYTWNDLQRWDRPAYRDARIWEVGTYPYYSLRLAHAGLTILGEVGVRKTHAHVQKLIRKLADNLVETRYQVMIFPNPQNRSCIVTIRGPRTSELHRTLNGKRIYTSLREGNIRVSPHFYNTGTDMDRLSHEIFRFDHVSKKR